MIGAALAALSFGALLALGWWERRKVPLVQHVRFRASTTGGHSISFESNGVRIVMPHTEFVASEPRRAW